MLQVLPFSSQLATMLVAAISIIIFIYVSNRRCAWIKNYEAYNRSARVLYLQARAGRGAISSDLYRTKKIAEFLNITLDQLKICLITLSRSEDQENTLGQACFYSFLKL